MRYALLVASFILLCDEAHALDCKPPSKEMARSELLFGAGAVPETAWHLFLSREVTPRFPDGLTTFDGYGQWKAPGGRIAKERSRILLLWHTPDAKADIEIDAIRDAYKKKFHQLSVMRVDGEDCVSF
jgi:Protein of unknown function (DUF3574)